MILDMILRGKKHWPLAPRPGRSALAHSTSTKQGFAQQMKEERNDSSLQTFKPLDGWPRKESERDFSNYVNKGQLIQPVVRDWPDVTGSKRNGDVLCPEFPELSKKHVNFSSVSAFPGLSFVCCRLFTRRSETLR